MKQIYSILCFFSISSIVYGRLVGEEIVGGDVASEGQFPYQVSIQIFGNIHICGGGILNERFILTAAHCVVDKSSGEFYNFDFKVVANTTDLNIPKKGRTVDVKKIYVLNKYKPPYRANDIAVLKLKSAIGLSDGIGKLELPKIRKNYDGQIAKIAGYGWNWIPVEIDPETNQTIEGIGWSNEKLNYLNVNIISNNECQQKNSDQIIYKTNICGQAVQRYRDGQLEGVCSNDSGGPLVIKNTVIGVLISSPLGCKENIEAAIYTRVSNFLQFIKNAMNGIHTARMRVRNLHINALEIS